MHTFASINLVNVLWYYVNLLYIINNHDKIDIVYLIQLIINLIKIRLY